LRQLIAPGTRGLVAPKQERQRAGFDGAGGTRAEAREAKEAQAKAGEPAPKLARRRKRKRRRE
jgi:hypothetical protein